MKYNWIISELQRILLIIFLIKNQNKIKNLPEYQQYSTVVKIRPTNFHFWQTRVQSPPIFSLPFILPRRVKTTPISFLRRIDDLVPLFSFSYERRSFSKFPSRPLAFILSPRGKLARILAVDRVCTPQVATVSAPG